MAQHTRQPDVLRELFAALGNDPFVIAECLARPALAERLLRFVRGSREAKRGASELTGSRNLDGTPLAGYSLPVIATHSDPGGSCIDDTSTVTSLSGAPDSRFAHTAVWTGTEMIVCGGASDSLPLN